jgi:hypothetical protein
VLRELRCVGKGLRGRQSFGKREARVKLSVSVTCD